jgi:hypothetical protein
MEDRTSSDVRITGPVEFTDSHDKTTGTRRTKRRFHKHFRRRKTHAVNMNQIQDPEYSVNF